MAILNRLFGRLDKGATQPLHTATSVGPAQAQTNLEMLRQKIESGELTSFVCSRLPVAPSTKTSLFTLLSTRIQTIPVHQPSLGRSFAYEAVKVGQFTVLMNLYLQRKLVFVTGWAAQLKDLFVRGLLWKRGKLFRPVTHVGLVGLSVFAIGAGSYINSSRVDAVDVTEEVIRATNVAETTIPEGRPRSEVINYQVRGGDTLSTIAEKFSISQDTIIWANSLSDPNSIAPGDMLKVPPVTGTVHTVKSGERLEDIAKKYQANAQAIVDFPFNDISDTFALKEGQTLIVPDGMIAPPKSVAPVRNANLAQGPARSADTNPSKTATGFMWPISGSITQYSSWYHPGAYDIQGPYGTPVHASEAGRVIVSQKLSYGYGWHVVIDHQNGYTTLYGHMSGLNVTVGQQVSKGEVVGWEGSTGRSTGPHVHFEVHKNGVAVNPGVILP